MHVQIPLNNVYLSILITVNSKKRKTFSAKITTDIQYNQTPLYGRLCNRMKTIPVPMVTLYQEGVKFSTIRRHQCLLCSKELCSSAAKLCWRLVPGFWEHCPASWQVRVCADGSMVLCQNVIDC
jgi:hypothetical protein